MCRDSYKYRHKNNMNPAHSFIEYIKNVNGGYYEKEKY